MIIPDTLYQPARAAENPTELVYRRIETALVPAGQTVNFARWPRDRMFIMQHMMLQVFISAPAGVSGSVVELGVSTQSVSLWFIRNVTNGVARPIAPNYGNSQAISDGVITPIAGSGRGSFDLTPSLKGLWLPFGASLDVSGSVTGVGVQWSITADYSGWIVDRGNLIGGS